MGRPIGFGHNPNDSTRHGRAGRRPAGRCTVVPHQQQSVRGHGGGELSEGPFELVQRVVAVEVVGLDAQDGGVPRPEVQEIGPILARLDQHQSPLPLGEG